MKKIVLFFLMMLPVVANADVVKIKYHENGVYYYLTEYHKESNYSAGSIPLYTVD